MVPLLPAAVLWALCALRPAAAVARAPQREREPRLVDLDNPHDVPEHLLFTAPLSGISEDPDKERVPNTPNLWVIMYQTKMSLAPLGTFLYSQLAIGNGSLQPEVLGQGTEWSGFSTKHHLAVQRMKKMSPDDLVVLSDFGDVVLNIANDNREKAVYEFKNTLLDMLNNSTPGSVVVSAEAQCCVAALSYHSPGELVDDNWTRVQRACDSGQPDCLGTDFPGTGEWEEFMQDLAIHRGHKGTKYPYLNAGLMAGRVQDMISMLEALQLEDEEDDQAVMTDLLYARPSSVMLDYDQRLFGNARWAMPGNKGCVFNWIEEEGAFRQQDTGTKPLFIHTSGKYFSCLRKVAGRFGWQASMAGAEFSAARHQGRVAATAAALVGLALSWSLA